MLLATFKALLEYCISSSVLFLQFDRQLGVKGVTFIWIDWLKTDLEFVQINRRGLRLYNIFVWMSHFYRMYSEESNSTLTHWPIIKPKSRYQLWKIFLCIKKTSSYRIWISIWNKKYIRIKSIWVYKKREEYSRN